MLSNLVSYGPKQGKFNVFKMSFRSICRKFIRSLRIPQKVIMHNVTTIKKAHDCNRITFKTSLINVIVHYCIINDRYKE